MSLIPSVLRVVWKALEEGRSALLTDPNQSAATHIDYAEGNVGPSEYLREEHENATAEICIFLGCTQHERHPAEIEKHDRTRSAIMRKNMSSPRTSVPTTRAKLDGHCVALCSVK